MRIWCSGSSGGGAMGYCVLWRLEDNFGSDSPFILMWVWVWTQIFRLTQQALMDWAILMVPIPSFQNGDSLRLWNRFLEFWWKLGVVKLSCNFRRIRRLILSCIVWGQPGVCEALYPQQKPNISYDTTFSSLIPDSLVAITLSEINYLKTDCLLIHSTN